MKSGGGAAGSPSLTRRPVRSDPGTGRQPALRPHAHKQAEKTTRVRTVLNEKQLHTLRTCYAANPRPDALMKEQLVEMTGLSPRVIRVWFQNKRCKDKKKSILMKQLQQQQHSDKTVSGRGRGRRVGTGARACPARSRSPGGLGGPGWGTGLSRPRAFAPSEQGFAWGTGVRDERIRGRVSRSRGRPELGPRRHCPEREAGRLCPARLARAGPHAWRVLGLGLPALRPARVYLEGGLLTCPPGPNRAPVPGDPRLKGGGKLKAELERAPTATCAGPTEPPGPDRDAPGGGQSHPPRERRAGQRGRGADVPAAVEGAQRVRAAE